MKKSPKLTLGFGIVGKLMLGSERKPNDLVELRAAKPGRQLCTVS